MTELIWEGKYDKDGRKVAPLRVALPFQTVETINESAKERQMSLEAWSSGKASEWRNRLIWGDKKYVLPALLEEFAGKINLIYIDPPFDTGQDFSFQVHVNGEDFKKEPSIIEQKAYRDTWGVSPEERAAGKTHIDKYLQWFYETVVLLGELLADSGSIYVHLDENLGHYAKLVLDEVFGKDNFRNHIVVRSTFAHADANQFGSIHQSLFWYSKGSNWIFNGVYLPYDTDYIEKYYRYSDPDGRKWLSASLTGAGSSGGQFMWRDILPPRGRHWAYTREKLEDLDKQGKIYWTKKGIPRLKQYLDEMPGVPASDVWWDKETQPVLTWTSESVDYPTQKSEALLDRIIRASSNENDLILDSFVGSGTTAVVAERLRRRWIGCDLSRFAIHTTRKRLLSVPDIRPFIVQNLGKYERQLWQTAEFGEQAEQRTLAYRRFILELYHAKTITGYTWLHGVKGGRMVHVGAVDSPVSTADVAQIATEFRKAVGTGKDAPKTNGVDVLGWDFAFELNEVAKQQAAQANINMRFLRIPREVLEKKAVEQADIHFFELAALSVDLAKKGRAATVMLTDFVIPPDDVPEEVRHTITHWEQWIDYWAVDWNNHGDTFHNEWQDYRTRQKRQLQKSVSHTYDQAGTYVIVVKVIDILGNDTTKTLNVEVR